MTAKAAAKATGQEETAEKKSADANSDKAPKSDDKEDKTEDKEDDTKEGGEGDEPSADAIKASLQQAEVRPDSRIQRSRQLTSRKPLCPELPCPRTPRTSRSARSRLINNQKKVKQCKDDSIHLQCGTPTT